MSVAIKKRSSIATLVAMLLKALVQPIALRFKKKSFHDAVKEADRLHQKTGQKAMVFFHGGEFKYITKKTIRMGKRKGFFKGLDYAAIEKRALYVKG